MSRLPPRIEQTIDGQLVAGIDVMPIVKNGITYTLYNVSTRSQHGTILAEHWLLCATTADDKLLWEQEVNFKKFDSHLELDVQETFPVDLAFTTDETILVKFEHYTDESGVIRVRCSDGAILS